MADVLVIGGGIFGLCVARALARRGAEVLLTEQDGLNRGASGANAGSLHFQLRRQDTELPFRTELIRRSILAWRSIQDTLDDDIEAHFHGGLMVSDTPEQTASLHAKLPADHAVGLTTRMLSGTEIAEIAPRLSPRLDGVAFCPEEGAVNPLLATPALARSARKAGAEILLHSPVTALQRSGDDWSVTTGDRVERVRTVVNAAGPSSFRVSLLAGAPQLSRPVAQMVSVLSRLPRVLVPMVQHIGARLTMKQTTPGTVLVGGGWLGDQTDVEAKLPDDEALLGNLAVAARVLPVLRDAVLLRTWAGTIAVTADNLPVIGEHPGLPGFVELLVPRGYAGYTFAPVLCDGVADALTGTEPEIDLQPYRPDRAELRDRPMVPAP